MAVTPIDLDEVRQQRLRDELPEARYEPGREQVSLTVPDDPDERFPAVVRAADVLLSVTRAAA
jgi:transcription-repair coupling factor (superfamily II helicase)